MNITYNEDKIFADGNVVEILNKNYNCIIKWKGITTGSSIPFLYSAIKLIRNNEKNIELSDKVAWNKIHTLLKKKEDGVAVDHIGSQPDGKPYTDGLFIYMTINKCAEIISMFADDYQMIN